MLKFTSLLVHPKKSFKILHLEFLNISPRNSKLELFFYKPSIMLFIIDIFRPATWLWKPILAQPLLNNQLLSRLFTIEQLFKSVLALSDLVSLMNATRSLSMFARAQSWKKVLLKDKATTDNFKKRPLKRKLKRKRDSSLLISKSILKLLIAFTWLHLYFLRFQTSVKINSILIRRSLVETSENSSSNTIWRECNSLHRIVETILFLLPVNSIKVSGEKPSTTLAKSKFSEEWRNSMVHSEKPF